jgi:hypothetical protein
MTAINQERLQYLQRHFDNQLVTIEAPATETMTTKGKVTYRFNGVRCGYKFKDGFTKVQRSDVYLFENQHFVIHNEENTNEKEGN